MVKLGFLDFCFALPIPRCGNSRPSHYPPFALPIIFRTTGMTLNIDVKLYNEGLQPYGYANEEGIACIVQVPLQLPPTQSSGS